ncbi:MAG: 16S rRNA (guanine(966)-N(2))-methyltransferase RsmD [Pseudomonadota bacterium]
MRIIAGRFRGRRLAALGKGDAGAHLRPTPDRVRESLFSMLEHQGALAGARVLDLFAGTGALGLEALSRGASEALFVENGRTSQRLISENIKALEVRDTARVFRQDATRLAACLFQPFDLLFLDPPYGKGLGEKALACALAGDWCAPGATVVWEEAAAMDAPTGFERQDHRRFGDTHVTLLRARG